MRRRTRGSLECYYVKRTDRVYRILVVYENVCGGVWLTQASVSCQGLTQLSHVVTRERTFSSQASGVILVDVDGLPAYLRCQGSFHLP